MSTAAPEIRASRWSAGHIALVVVGVLLGLVGLGLTAGGAVLVWADQTQRDDDGYVATSFDRFTSSGYALASERFEIHGEGPDWLFEPGRIGPVRLQARSDDGAVFLGIASTSDVTAYLDGVSHDVVTDVSYWPFEAEYAAQAGAREPTPPAEAGFWAASTSGSGTQSLVWNVAEGDWTVVVMNADGSRGVAADVSVGAEADWLGWLGAALLAVGAVAVVGAIGLGALGVRGQPTTAAVAETAPAGAYPADVHGELAPHLSRWLWLVKWFLAIPHLVVLVFLWAAFALLTVAAFFAILFTGRYPRSLFDFNVGVLRWTWRVAFYATGPIATDRYPPFTLGDADYPATLEVAYPERLSRGLVLVKWWLLAIPHYLVLAVFFGNVGWTWDNGVTTWLPSFSLILTLVVGFSLLFRGAYPRDLYELLVGIGRWTTRVVAYAALMRDEYPPFRFGK